MSPSVAIFVVAGVVESMVASAEVIVVVAAAALP
jgi:hypothetical protein